MKPDANHEGDPPESGPPQPKYLRLDRMKAGDVILSASHSNESALIAAASHEVGSESWFSHAAILMGGGWVFEADGDGLLPRPLLTARTGLVKSSLELAILHDVSDCSAITVLRHPAFENVESHAIEDGLHPVIERYWGLEYPTMETLAAAAASSSFGQWVAKLGLDGMDKLDHLKHGGREPVVPGPFCSMLVALVFEDIKVTPPLFTPHRPAATVSPNSLADHSCLRVVPDVVVPGVAGMIDDAASAMLQNRALLHDFRDGVSLHDALKRDRDCRIEQIEAKRLVHLFKDKVDALRRDQEQWLSRLRR